MSFLTEKQWSQVGAVISVTPGLKEIVVNKDAFGNAEVDFCGEECFKRKHLKGNVIQFPLDHMAPPEPSRVDRILDKITGILRDLYIDLGVFLGFLEDDEEERVD